MKIARSRYDVFVEFICLLCLFGLVLYLMIAWPNIPDEIPGRYNTAGEITRMTNKGSLIVLPVISLIMYAGMSIIERFSQIWNTGITVTEGNKEEVYRTLKNLLGTVKLLIVVNFSYLTVCSSRPKPLPVYYTPVFLFLMFAILIFFIVKLVSLRRK